jgi:hypothetical protein
MNFASLKLVFINFIILNNTISINYKNQKIQIKI